MKFPHLAWAIAQRGLANYQAADAVGLNETRFSRGLSGRVEFSLEERAKLACFLRYPEKWLFEEMDPPTLKRTQRGSTSETATAVPA
jgi:hypothetical protein